MNQIQKYTLPISFDSDVRRITVNSSTRINDIIKRSLDVFDLQINNIAGIYFFFIDANVYLGDCEENNFDKTYRDLIEEYDESNSRIFYIDNILSTTREQSSIDDFRVKFQIFNSNQSQNYYFRPTFNITNNYPSRDYVDYIFEVGDLSGNRRRRTPEQQPREQNPPEQASGQQSNNNTDQGFNIPHWSSNVWTTPINQQNGQTTGNYTSPTTNLLQSIFTNTLRNATNTPAYVASFGNYADILTSLNGILNPGDRHLLTAEQINNLAAGNYVDLLSQGLILPECTQCNITLEEFSSESRVIALPCKHAFHENAIRYWLTNNSNRCPICRANVIPNN